MSQIPIFVINLDRAPERFARITQTPNHFGPPFERVAAVDGGALSESGGGKSVVAAGVCTAKRPRMLLNCLRSLAAQNPIEGFEINVIVADNDAVPRAERIVAEFAANCPFPVHYRHEPRRGISTARNRVLDEALRLDASWLAFIDDDQIAPPDWLAKLLEAALRHGADAVQPRIISILPDPAPFWLIGVNLPAAAMPGFSHEGEVRKSAGTGGTMFSTRLIRADGMGLRFDERLAFQGGEDAAFFHAAHGLGARIVSSNLPTVMEEVHPSRLTYLRNSQRGLAQGGRAVTQHRRAHGFARTVARYAAVGTARALRGAGQLLISPFFIPFDLSRFKFTALEGGRNLFYAAGVASAFFSYQYQYYREIDGY